MFNLHFRIYIFAPAILALALLTLPHACSNLSLVSHVAVSDDDAATSSHMHAVKAMCSIIREHFEPFTLDFTLSTHAVDRQTSWLIEDSLSELLPHLNYIKVTLENIDGTEKNPLHRNFNLIIVDGLEALEALNPAEQTRFYDTTETYLMYLVQRTVGSVMPLALIDKLLEYFWRNSIINVSLLVETSTVKSYTFSNVSPTTALYTYFPFKSADSCKRPAVASINTFTGFWHNHSATEIFPPKLLNLHGCPLRIAVWQAAPYLSIFPNKSGFERLGDFEGQLVIKLAQKLNFTLDLIVPPNEEERGMRFPNGSTSGAMKLVSMLQEKQADFSLGSFRYTMERSHVLTATLPYYQTWQTYGVLLKIQPYASLEILSFAFDGNTWICLCLSLVTALAIGYFGQRYRSTSWLATKIMGTPKNARALDDIVGTFLGNPITRPPQSHFTRFVIVLWFIYGLLIRTAYQSLLFKLLQSNLYQTPPQSQMDLVTQGYTLVMTQRTYEAVQTAPRMSVGMPPLILLNISSDLSTYAYIDRAPDKRLAGVSPMDFLIFYVQQAKRRGEFYILPEKVFAQHITMYLTKHSYLIERFDFVLMNLRSQGLIDYWASQSVDMSYFARDEAASVLAISYKRIAGVFIVYEFLVGVAFVVFCLEILCGKIMKMYPVLSESNK